MTNSDFNAFVTAYVVAGIELMQDADTTDKGLTIYDFAEKAVAAIKADCSQFISDNKEDIDLMLDEDKSLSYEAMGNDFWLTRNGHGAGFWDGDYPEPYGDRLTEAAKKFPNVEIVIGDDGKLYQE